ncbi:oxygenase MpaB family protein [Haloechinothrix aidingensis]|uniref:oxygenase MpaB family protein n=1 Tax=Haloechinothrix aidingensis TaxID=2752311 RepID=UPI0031B5FEF4
MSSDVDTTGAGTERLPDPELFTRGPLRLARSLWSTGDVRAEPAQLRRLRMYAAAGDPPADAVVQLLEELPAGRGRELFEQALTGGIDSVSDAPEPLVAFFTDVEAPPYWVDPDRLERGARAITRTGLLGMFPLADMSLMGGYLASRAAKTLVSTGDLEHMAPKRLIETATWWLDVTTPGAMRHGEKGYCSALRVRLVHAHVRAAMNRRDDWDYESWDLPVNQVQTVGTLLLFSQVFVLGTQMLGIRYARRERDDILHLWRYIGWLMGVDEGLLPAGEDDAWRMLWLLASTEFIPDEDSRRLANALLRSHSGIGERFGPLSGLVSTASTGLHAAISRMLLGDANADFLDLPNQRLAKTAVLGLAAANFATETVRSFVPGATMAQEKLGAFARGAYARQLGRLVPLDPTYASHMRSNSSNAAKTRRK